MTTAGAIEVAGGAGRIEALLKVPAGAPRAAAVVCHPHPLFGGTMHNKVVYRAAQALVSGGVATLCFNFRGVGLSAGVHDGGRGERDDVALLLDELVRRFPGLPLVAAGYSFGAWVGLRAGATDPRVRGLLGIGLATRYHDFEEVVTTSKPVLLIQGVLDELGPIDEVRILAARFVPPASLVEVPGADHFFAAGLERVAGAVEGYARELLESSP